jgi:1-acyl-sn-glycerol-3-phosphate acyltransferase
MGMRLHTAGAPPPPPFLLVSNHLSYVDILAFASIADCIFVAKSDLSSWPVVGSLCRVGDVVFVDRTLRRDVGRVNGLIDEAIRNGEGVMVFPEGTSTGGQTVLPFMSSLLDGAARDRIPVHTASILYRTTTPDMAASDSVCWWGDMTFTDHFFALLGMRTFDAWIRHGSASITRDDRKQLARDLHTQVLADFEILAEAHSDGRRVNDAEEMHDDVHGELAS